MNFLSANNMESTAINSLCGAAIIFFHHVRLLECQDFMRSRSPGESFYSTKFDIAVVRLC